MEYNEKQREMFMNILDFVYSKTGAKKSVGFSRWDGDKIV